jgi:hypothetical protein
MQNGSYDITLGIILAYSIDFTDASNLNAE